tara:strand:- start:11159 stop:13930 length:2772 start_codon:yes stop_codon:yes gene_type:complete
MAVRKPLLLLMDGHAMVYRSWYGIQQPMNVTATGEEVRGVYGFLNTFLRTLSDWDPTHCAISFDMAKPTFRHKVFDEYKAQRTPSPPELRAQFPHVRKMMEAFRVPIFEKEGYEADDILGTLCRVAEEKGVETILVTGDTDELQLVSPLVRVLLTHGSNKKNIYGIEEVRYRYEGLGPDSIADIKALQGDPSDNIPGVPGVGKKTAIRLLNDYGSIEGIYQNLSEVTPPRIQQSLRENQTLANQSKFLTTIVRDVPIKVNFDDMKFGNFERTNVIESLRELEFFSIVQKVPHPKSHDSLFTQAEMAMELPSVDINYEVVDTIDKLDLVVAELHSPSGFSFILDTDSENPMEASFAGISFSKGSGKSWYVPVGHQEGSQIESDLVISQIKPLLESSIIPKVTHNANYQYMGLYKYGVRFRNLTFDTSIAAHLCGWVSSDLNSMALKALGIEIQDSSEITGVGRNRKLLSNLDINVVAKYSCARANAVFRLRDKLIDELQKAGSMKVMTELEMPLFQVLVRMQLNGVHVDSKLLNKMSKTLGAQISHIENNLHSLLGYEFNLNSSKELSEVLFTQLKLPHTKRTQKGNYSTDASSLDTIKEMISKGVVNDPDPRSITLLDGVSEYRQMSKIKSTYVDSLPDLVNKKTNRIHTRYNQTGSTTGRISSNEPNVQNIPVRTELGRNVRNAFVAEKRPEWTLLAADYSQIELRVLAHVSEDSGLIAAFKDGQDIHTATAASVYDVPTDVVNSDMRRVAKIMNFGVLYGLSSFGISKQTGLTMEEGKRFIEEYFRKYPGIKDYIEKIKSQVFQRGYVETLMGRRRYIFEAQSSNRNIRSSGERMAVNMPIQGTAADILKIAMLRLQSRIDEIKLNTMMILQVHDELIFEVPREELHDVTVMVSDLMPNAIELLVPLEVEIKVGDMWGEMK